MNPHYYSCYYVVAPGTESEALFTRRVLVAENTGNYRRNNTTKSRPEEGITNCGIDLFAGSAYALCLPRHCHIHWSRILIQHFYIVWLHWHTEGTVLQLTTCVISILAADMLTLIVSITSSVVKPHSRNSLCSSDHWYAKLVKCNLPNDRINLTGGHCFLESEWVPFSVLEKHVYKRQHPQRWRHLCIHPLRVFLLGRYPMATFKNLAVFLVLCAN